MIRAQAFFIRGGVSLALVLLFAGATSPSAAVTTYSDLESFFLASGSRSLTGETFDNFENGTPINDQIPGVFFSSPNADLEGYVEIQAFDSIGAVSRPNVLFGGLIPSDPDRLQIMVLDFSPSITAFAFNLVGYDPAAGPASVRLIFDDETSEAFLLSNRGESATTPVFFGAISSTPIFRVTLTSGLIGEGFEEFGIDDLLFGTEAAEDDTDPPICTAAPATEEDVLGINGSASDAREGDTGIETVELSPDSVNLTLATTEGSIIFLAVPGPGVDAFEPGAGRVLFRVAQDDPESDATGTVIATDGAGHSCSVPVDFRALPPGPTVHETLCSGGGILFSVSNDATTPAGTAACSATPPGGAEPPFPPGYETSPEGDPSPCTILTIESPIAGTTEMVLKKDGDFDERLRLLFSESADGGLTFPDFRDVTESVDEIATITPDPTRLVGTVQWTPVKVTCALLTESVRLTYCGGLVPADPGPDFDGDGSTLCAAASSDCNDQIAAIHPGASEQCNGMDDDCDGAIDEGSPLPPAGEDCTIPGLLGACTVGVPSCEAGPLVCKQTVFPVEEVACNEFDDDCDGRVDGVHVFGGYLAPINPDGSTVFVKKRGAIPVRFQLRDCSGAFVDDAVATIQVLFHGLGVVGDEEIDVSSVGNANTGNLYRFDADSHQYIYNLDASSLERNASYIIRTSLDDGSEHDVLISIK